MTSYGFLKEVDFDAVLSLWKSKPRRILMVTKRTKEERKERKTNK